ncbi:MAG: DUF4062 domain-containing protein [Candidatus Marinimicrobia bacterium]|nr:DUF4062 domain-containing protein [Candidatus Neomarinimicrobiota bacterium]
MSKNKTMPPTVSVIRVFISSPSDVADERATVSEIIEEINKIGQKEKTIILQAVLWETDVHPAFSSDSQEVINEQVSDEYEIFVGIMWSKFGTPTKRAESGTVEEFRRAYRRFEKDHNSVTIMFYFKDTPIAPSRINTDEIIKIQSFRNELMDKGGLFKEFKSLDEFKALLRLNLTAMKNEWRSRISPLHISLSQKVQKQVGAEIDVSSTEDDELGYLELLELGIESFYKVTIVVGRMTNAMEELGKKTTRRTSDLKKMQHVDGLVWVKKVKSIAKKSAIDMEEYVARTETEIPLFSAALRDGIRSFGDLANLSTDFDADNIDDLQDSLGVVSGLKDAIIQTSQQIEMFMQTVDSLPRLTKRFIRAKRRTVAVLNRVIEEYQAGQLLAVEVERVIAQVISRANG